jgi:hypothetical protein
MEQQRGGAGGNRRRAPDEFLEARVAEGYRIEAHEATHAIVVQGDGSRFRRLLGRRRRRFVVQVDEHGTVSMRPAEPCATRENFGNCPIRLLGWSSGRRRP